MKSNYKTDRLLLSEEIDLSFEGTQEVDSFIQELRQIQIFCKQKHGDSFDSCVVEEIRTGYEDWYFVVMCYYWESESEFEKRLKKERTEELREIRQKEKLEAKKKKKDELEKQIASLINQKNKLGI